MDNSLSAVIAVSGLFRNVISLVQSKVATQTGTKLGTAFPVPGRVSPHTGLAIAGPVFIWARPLPYDLMILALNEAETGRWSE